MTFEVLTPPDDADNLTRSSVEVIKAAIDMGLDVEPEGFIYSWIAGSRLVVKRDAERNIVGIAMFSMGKRWTHSDMKAHVLILLGETQELLDYIVNMARAIGVSGVFYQDSLINETETHREYLVREIIVE